jgi:hypothetical protein
MLTKTIPSYLYWEYSDVMAQDYVTWFATASLPIYTLQSGDLLDWVASGLYGVLRPNLQSAPASDDVFKRCMMWSQYKGDGKQFNIRWLKRRLQRWLDTVDGIPKTVDQTYQISITFGAPNIVYINILQGTLTTIGGIEFNQSQFNTMQLNELDFDIANYVDTTLSATLRDAINSGILELPFQYTYVVGINP